MSKRTFTHRSLIHASADEVFRWHAAKDAFDKLWPPWHRKKVIERTGGITNGARTTVIIYAGLLPIRWTLEHRDYIEGIQFKDIQVQGPFRSWAHTHLMEPVDASSCYLIDRIDYELPFAMETIDYLLVRELKRLFEYRHSVILRELEAA